MRAAILLFLGLFAGLTPGQASAEKRVALVIGNGDYQNVTKLPNPANDARAIAALLQSAGFEVISGVDLKRDEMVSRIGQFGDSVRAGADAAVVFYAGHGVQIAGKNYLIPIDADLHSAYDVKVRTSTRTTSSTTLRTRRSSWFCSTPVGTIPSPNRWPRATPRPAASPAILASRRCSRPRAR